MNVRHRSVRSLLALSAFSLLAWVFHERFWLEPWFPIALGVAASAAFVEHFFTRPQEGIVNALAALGVLTGSDSLPRSVRVSLAAIIGIVFVASLIAVLASEPSGPIKRMAFQVATRFGRAVVIGGLLLGGYVLAVAAEGEEHPERLALASLALILVLSIDWKEFAERVWRRDPQAASAIGAIGPRRLLISLLRGHFGIGDRILVSGASGAEVSGHVVAQLPHREGTRLEVVLDDDWLSICESFPAEIRAIRDDGEAAAIGVVGEGSTALSIELQPFSPLSIGDPLVLRTGAHDLLYQVASLELRQSSWAGAAALAPHASARRVGWPVEGTIRSVSYLPDPHALVHRYQAGEERLPERYLRIGAIKGTDVPIGLSLEEERRGHLAILGMSGMGKTVVAHRIAASLGQESFVLALDTTGEYSARLGVAEWGQGYLAPGLAVHEPVGDPPYRAATLINECMDVAASEYRDGTLALPRVILLEEAHTFIPEWNFALRDQQGQVARTTRMVMQSRKYRVSFIVVSQRTAVVSKSALSQCENYVILRTLDATSLEYVESVVGKAFRKAIPALSKYEALCVGPSFNSEEPVIIQLDPP